MASPSVSGMHDNLTALRMKLLNQKLVNERNRLETPSETGDPEVGENVKLHQAVLRRQELLDRLGREQVAADLRAAPHRPHSTGRPTSPPPHPPPSRRSLPDLHNQQEMNYPTPRAYFLPPMQPPPAHAAAPVMVHPPYVPPQVVAVPTAVPAAPEQRGSSWNKGDFIEMMMMQNVQMHQMVMQQMMMSSFPGNKLGAPPPPQAPPPQPTMAPQPAPQPVFREREVAPPPAVHHHHYGPPLSYRQQPLYRPPIHHYTLPPIDVRSRYYPERNVSVKGARMKPKVEPRKKKDSHPYPFPGTKNIRKLRHLFYATWFVKILQALAKKNSATRPSTVFLFGVTLKEIVAAIHRLYIDPHGSIFPMIRGLMDPIAEDLSQLVDPKSVGTPNKSLLDRLDYVVQNLVYHITEIMPKTGVLGTHKKAGVFEMIMNGKRYPDGYFWKVEMDRLQFNDSGRTVNVGDKEAMLLLNGIFLSRGMVSTLLLNPQDYGLYGGEVSQKAERNLQLLASLLMYLVRKVASQPGEEIMDIPSKLGQYLLSDNDLKNLLSKMKKTLDFAESQIRDWSTEYVRKLRVAGSTHKS